MNGLEGSISDKTFHFIKLLDWGLNQQRNNVLHYGDFDVNLLSCISLKVEHFHSLVNHNKVFKQCNNKLIFSLF